MDSTSADDIVEEREELMVCNKNPCFNSIDGSEAMNLSKNRSVSSPLDLKALPLSVSFHGWRFANRNFKSWAIKMAALHETTWRKAGIFEAIMASTHRIYRNTDLVLGIAEKWCPDTKTFVFSWGEATITLEDVMVLLGFSVLGLPVFAILDSLEKKTIQRDLEKEWVKIKKDQAQFLRQVPWMERFMDSGDELEHVAFLVLWLSYFVFPSRSYHIDETIFPIAVHLSNGTRIAIAPAVLAHLYSELTLLKAHIRDFAETTDKIEPTSLFKLVQVWTWERFKNLRPEAKVIPKGEPRISRWDGLKQKTKKARLNLYDFDWRPYTKPLNNWNPLGFYVEEAMWITTDNNPDEKFLSFARCVSSSQLVGIGYIEDYYPNRVALQFGSVQDLPDLVNKNFTEKEAWDDYNKSIDGLRLYMPSRLAQGSVTARYQDWWLKSVSEEMQRESAETFNARNACKCDDVDVSPKVLPLSIIFQKLEEGFPAKFRKSRTPGLVKNLRSEMEKDKRGELVKSLVHSGWKLKRTSAHLTNKTVELNKSCMDGDDDDNMTVAQMIRSGKKYNINDAEKTGGDASEPFGKRARSNDSETPQKLDSVKIEQMSEEDDENTSKAQKTKQLCDDDVNGGKREEKSVIDDEPSNEKLQSEAEKKDIDERLKQRKFAIEEKAECLLQEAGEKQSCDEKLCSEVEKEDDDNIDERLKQKKLAIEEIALKLEARIIKQEKNLAQIRKWITSRRNQIQTIN